MQDPKTYSISNDKLRLLLQGSAGSGKSTLAAQFPGAYFIDVDVNLGGTFRYLREHNLKLPLGYDVLDRDEKDQPVDIKQRFLRLDKCLREAQLNPAIETIILDSGTTLADVLIAEVCRQQGKNAISDWKDGRQFWGFFAPLCRNFLGVLSQMRKHIVLIVHEKREQNTEGQVIYPIKVAWPGQVGQNIGAFFTNVWRCENKVEGYAPNEKVKFYLRTTPNGQYELKNTLGVPNTFEFDWKIIEAKLKGGATMVAKAA